VPEKDSMALFLVQWVLVLSSLEAKAMNCPGSHAPMVLEESSQELRPRSKSLKKSLKDL
jgi:hypothetical protein